MRRARFNILAAGLLAAAAVLPARGTQVKIFQARSQTAFLAGTLDGVSVDALGRMQLAPKVDRVASVAEPFLLSAAVHPDGWVVGTGNAGKVLKIDRKGGVTELFTAPEPEIFAVWSDPDGTVYAGTSPNGKVYRIPPGQGSQGRALLRSQGDLHLGPGARRRRLPAGRHRHRGQALPRRRQGEGNGPLRQRRHPHPDARVAPRRGCPGRHRRRGPDPADQPRRPGAHPL